MSSPITLVYYDLRGPDSGHNPIDYREHPELHADYVTREAAQAAGEAVFARVVELYRARCKAREETLRPDAVKRAWENDKRHACFTETRIVGHRIAWQDEERYLGAGWDGTLYLDVETRHRWREVEMRTAIAKDGTTTITHALGKPLPWSAWSREIEGGFYVPRALQLVVRRRTITLAADREALAAWVREPEVNHE